MKTVRTTLALNVLFFMAVGHALGQEKPALRDIDRVRLAEAFRLGEKLKDDLWPGWSRAPFAVLLVTPDKEFLIRHPRPSEDFTLLGHDAKLDSNVYYRDRKFSTNLLATFPAVGGVSTIVIGQAENTASKTSTPWVIKFLHEHFHQLQDSQPNFFKETEALNLSHGDQTGMWMLNYPFPYASVEIGQQFSAVARLLVETMEAKTQVLFSSKLAAYLEARQRLKSLLSADDYKYLSFQLWKEGIARYTEDRIAHWAAANYEPTREFRELKDFTTFKAVADQVREGIVRELSTLKLEDYKRVAFYPLGAGEGLVLDRANPKWRSRYFAEKFDNEKYFHTSSIAQTDSITRQEMLRGSVTPEREWWDVLHYHLQVEFFPERQRLRGSNTITFKTSKPGKRMQIDLQPPLSITKITHGDSQPKFEREGNVYWVAFAKDLSAGAEEKIEIFYEGVPVVSKNPPWVGGITWGRDDLGEHFIVTTCQGVGASIWWPNKDHGSDEPDRGMQISVTVPEPLTAVANGRLKKTDHDVAEKKKTFHWEVLNPINNYGVNVNIGNYITFSEKYKGQGGVLDIDYWVLPHQKESALRQFKEVRRTIEAFEHWFGKYPFYEDSFKLVTVSYPGMEHQSSVTYGNWFRNGYRQRDPCGCGVGMKFDFIIVHESAHEWFGNNVSMKDAADMWIHEGFANYAENLFVEYHFGKKDAEDYVVGSRRGIRNDRPIIGVYGSNREGSGDMYPKGGNMLHTIRHVINDDAKWLSILRGLNADFWHQTVTTEQIESYISNKAGIDLSKVFDQYLRTTNIPLFRYKVNGKSLSFNYERVVQGFAMPVRVAINGKEILLTPNEVKQTIDFPEEIKTLEVNRNFYIESQKDL